MKIRNIFIYFFVLTLSTTLYAVQLKDNNFEAFKTEIEENIKNSVKTDNINKKHAFGGRALIFAAIDGDLDKVKELWEQGVDLNATDELGDTALIKAASQGHADVVDFLVTKGANPDIQGLLRNTALMNAIVFEHVDIVRILAPVSNLNKKNNSDMTALKLAKKKGNKEIISIVRQAIKKHFKDALSDVAKEYVDGVSSSNGRIDK